MSDWSEFTAAILVFYASHMIPARPAIRDGLTAGLGERLYLLLYAALSIVLLAWLIGAAGRAPYVPLWERDLWQNNLPLVLMVPACLLAVFGIGAPGGLSLGSRSKQPFDPARPGIAAITRHPLLWALTLWSLAHLAPNGDLAHGLLFGSFALTALLGMVAFDRRARRRLGEASWREVRHATSFVPRPRWPSGGGFDQPWLRVVIAIGIYAVLLTLHAPVIGVSPM